MKYTSESKYVCSIYPGVLPPYVANVGPDPSPRKGRRTVYQLEPIKRFSKRKPFQVLEVSDAFENVPDIKNATGGRMPFVASPVPCEEIVKDMINFWTGNMPGLPMDARPGIMEIVLSTPTQDELKRMEAMQTKFFEYMFQQGEEHHREGKWNRITPAMRDACEWLGYERTWSHPEKSAEQIPCPNCAQLIRPIQKVCHHCQRDVNPPEDPKAKKELAAV